MSILTCRAFTFSYFLTCKTLIKSLILGIDFIQRHKTGSKWSDTGKGLLTHGKNMVVENINVCKVDHHILAHSNLKPPPRTFMILNAHVELGGNPKEQTYSVKPNSLLSDQYPSMVVMPAINITPKQVNTVVCFFPSKPLNIIYLFEQT